MTTLSARERFIEYRRNLPKAPRLDFQVVEARGLRFAVWMSPEVKTSVPPLLVINGGLIYDHSPLWPALAPLAQTRRIILYDQRGRGQSTPPPGPRVARLEHDASDVAALRAGIGYRTWDILGHSWGGAIAMLATEEDRESVRRLVLVNSVGPTSDWLPGLHERALLRLSGAERVSLLRLDPSDLHVPDPERHSAYSRAIYPAWFADADLSKLFALPRSESVTGATVAARLRREGYDWRERIKKISTPALVLHGDKDLLPSRVAQELASLMPNSTLDIFPGSGHMPFWEAPEKFFRRVASFLIGP